MAGNPGGTFYKERNEKRQRVSRNALAIFFASTAFGFMFSLGTWLFSQTTYPLWRTVGGATLAISSVALVAAIAYWVDQR